ncbi:MAG: hypothetical protein G01um101419_472 [Parcubacteria group bacterium Gr01-1014_19]|nr:MAG: hypothetical protein G01um101419_472 [Parcubacteria group bacterium Gr01-1014_19]
MPNDMPGDAPKAVCVFRCKGKTEILDIPTKLFEELIRTGFAKKKLLTKILARACAKYGVSVESVERYLIEDC